MRLFTKDIDIRVERHSHRIAELEDRNDALRDRLKDLESEVQECRELNQRLAEVTDVVVELLLPATDRDEKRLRKLLKQHRL